MLQRMKSLTGILATSDNSTPPATGSSSSSKSGSSTDTGAIAGGVVGAIVGILAIAVLTWGVRRRRRPRIPARAEGSEYRKPELDTGLPWQLPLNNEYPAYEHAHGEPTELPAASAIYEKLGTPRNEKFGTPRSELPGDSKNEAPQ